MNPKSTRAEGYKGPKVGTFGGSQAAANLDKILFELEDGEFKEKCYKFIGSRVQDWQFSMRQLILIPDRSFRIKIVELYRNLFFCSIEDYGLPPIIESHFLNMLTTIKKEYLRKVDKTNKKEPSEEGPLKLGKIVGFR